MKINEKIRALREINQWSQEEMAEKMQMSKNGYARIERGESKLDISRLEKIAEIFNLDVVELISSEEKSLILQIIGNNGNNTNYGSIEENIIFENEKLKLKLQYKDEIIAQKEQEITMLKEVLDLLKSNSR